MAAILTTPTSSAPAPVARRRLPPLLLMCAVALPAQGPGEQVEVARKALSEWTETQRILSKEKQDWRVGKEALRARIDVAKREIGSLAERITGAEASIAEADTKRAELLAEKEALQQVAAALEERLAGLESSVRRLLPRLPEPLVERIKPLSQRIPEGPAQAAESKLSLSERYQNVIGVLDQIGKWNREITIGSEVREQADGSSVEVAVIYVGLGQGYYAGRKDAEGKATVGGIGTATAEGWVWKPANELAPAIDAAIAVYKNEQLARLVRLPVQIL